MPRRVRRLVAVIAALVLSTSVASAGAGSDGSPVAHMLSSVRDSADLSGPALIDGRLVDAAGHGVSGQIRVIAWPTLEVLGALQPGDDVRTLEVAAAEAAADGSFLLRVDPAVPIGGYREDNGIVNFSLLASGPVGTSAFGFGGRLDSNANRWVASGSTGAGAASPQRVTLPLTGPALAVSAQPEPLQALDRVWPCTDDVLATYNQRLVSVGEVYPGPHATGDFQYIHGAESSLGVGFSASGNYGSFSQSGTSTTSSTATINYPTQPKNAKTVFRTTYQYKKFRVWIPTDFGCQPAHVEVRPTAFDGGASSYTAAGLPTANNCSAVQVVPTTLTKQTANAVTWSNAVKLGSVIGIDVSGRTGFSTEAKIAFNFTAVGSLCGTNSSWPNAQTVRGK